MRLNYFHRANRVELLTASRKVARFIYRAVIVGVQKDKDRVAFRFVVRMLQEFFQLVFQVSTAIGRDHLAFTLRDDYVGPVVLFQENPG